MNSEQKALFKAIEEAIAEHKNTKKPYVMLTYAQTLNGSIALSNTNPLALSCQESLLFTHRLRSLSDGILVGVGTVLSDDPKLTTRLTEGESPRAIVLDSNLRIPANAALFKHSDRNPWIVTAPGSSPARRTELRMAGGQIIEVPRAASGKLDIVYLLPKLADQGLHVLMVEGGQQVITDFIYRQSVDEMLITITPTLCSGLNAVETGFSLERNLFRITGQAGFDCDLVVRLTRRCSDDD